MINLQAAINRYVEEHNPQPKLIVWTADPDVQSTKSIVELKHSDTSKNH